MILGCLSDLLSSFESDRLLWIDPSDQSWSCARLKEHLKTCCIASADTSVVAIESRDALRLALSLIALDGRVDTLALVPPHIDVGVRAELHDRIGVQQIFDDAKIDSFLRSTDGDADVFEGTRTGWVLATSGTTGQPKLVRHDVRSLTQSAKFDAIMGRSRTWASLYNLTGFAGLQVFLQSWCGGSTFVMPLPTAPLDEQLARYAKMGVNCLSATPTMWRKILMTASAERLPLRQITLGGEIADAKVLSALAKRYPTARLTQVYASTEAGVGFSVRDGLAGFPASYLTAPPAGVRVSVRDGKLFLAKDVTTQSFVGGTDELVQPDGFIETGDVVRRDGDRFHFVGRENGTINVGGNKVQPETVEHWLLAQPEISQARVCSKVNPFSGTVVAAEVVLDVGVQRDEKTLRTDLSRRARLELPPYSVPAIIRCVKDLPINEAGKLKRSA